MKLIKPSYSILTQEPGLEGIYKMCEIAGRNCYKSEPKEGVSSKDFVDKMINRGHSGVLEHGTVYIRVPAEVINLTKYKNVHKELDCLLNNSYTKAWGQSGMCFITNLRVLIENNLKEVFKYICEPIEYHEKRVTVKFTSNIHFYKDLTRHRTHSFCIESTRYCNYSKDKFDEQLTFIQPLWFTGDYTQESIISNKWLIDNLPQDDHTGEKIFLSTLLRDESCYLNLIKLGWKPEQAAEILPQATKADIICTGFISDWQHIFEYRTSYIAKTGKPHSEVSRLIDPLYNEFKEKGLIQ